MKHHLFTAFFIALFPFVEPYAFIKWPWQQESKQAKLTPGSADFIYNNCAREVKLHFLKQQYPNSTLISRKSFVKDLSKMPTNMSASYLNRKRCQLEKMIEVSGLNNLLSFIEQDFHQIGKLLIQTNLTLENCLEKLFQIQRRYFLL